jgi:5-(carboxyamino)imidazole ribonucleotide synthase
MKRVGVIGGGQLAWMMGAPAKKLDVELVIQTPSQNDPAVMVANDTVFASVDDAEATAKLANKCDVVTFENEFVNLDKLSLLAQKGVSFRPRLEALAPLLDKYHQRCFLRDLGLAVPNFVELGVGNGELGIVSGFPVVIKARRHGYDGQGTFIVRDLDALNSFLAQNNQTLPSLLLEEYIPFERELAVIAARSTNGEVVIYPVVETKQEQQVCRRVIAPADISPVVAKTVEEIARTILNSLQVVGVFGIELFLTTDDKVLVNEIAPRTHNSGHFTLDACETSQFEMQLRCVCGLPLGNPALICPGAVMVNLLGYENSSSDYNLQRSQISQIPNAHLHWYGKKESRPGRKLGHVTVLLEGANPENANAIANEIESIWYSPEYYD